MRSYHFFAAALTLAYVTSATYSGQYCPSACETCINYVSFNDTDPGLSRKVRSCRSELRITSIYLCFDEFCKQDGQTEEWIKGQSAWCDEYANVTLPSFQDVLGQWSPVEKAEVKRISADEALKFPLEDEVVIPDLRLFDRAFTTMVGLFQLSLLLRVC
jgi:hypothetical protein